MSRHELDLITDELATCLTTGFNEDDTVSRLCDIAHTRHYLAYNSRRAIDKILTANHEEVERFHSLSGAGLKPSSIKVNTGRFVEIIFQLGEAISARNHQLARQAVKR